jgi:uncharacterized protein (TIGR02452 family)
MSLKDTAQQTLRILDQGSYVAPSGRVVAIGDAVAEAVAGTILFRPGETDAMIPSRSAGACRIEITGETTGAAGRRLAASSAHVAVLNFASAKNPGGGFLGNAISQEEDLARASALYPCLLTQRAYYDFHRGSDSMLYSDHVIYSPGVPFFRGDRGELLEDAFRVAVITSPAPNAGEALRRDANARPAIERALVQRARVVLDVAASFEHRVLVLGAWGCGVFRNDPQMVANAFGRWLDDPRFAGVFERVVFAVYDRSPFQTNLGVFRARFALSSNAAGDL